MSLIHRLAIVNPDAEFRPLTSDEAVISDRGESLTIQSQSADTDINVMIGRFGVGAKLPENPRVPMYGDFHQIKDFQSALNSVIEAEDAFMEFPASIREKFKNSPQVMMEFCSNADNFDDAVKMGLIREESIKSRDEAFQAKVAAKRAEIVEAAKAAGLVLQPEKTV